MEKLKFKKAVVSIPLHGGAKDIQGLTCGGLMIHRHIIVRGDGSVFYGRSYVVTHAPSGLIIVDEIGAFKAARKAVADLLPLADWTANGGVLTQRGFSDPEFKANIMRILREARAT